MLISGRCHCGNISFALDWRPEPSEMIADDGIGFDHSTENTGRRRGLSVMQRLAVQADTEIVWELAAIGTRMTMTINCIPRQEND
jgi:nitrate/nitrite-specific signal transduction histidine kinase